MKATITFLLIYSTLFASAQLSFPAGFHVVRGENLSGEDDVYTNGRYSFQTHLLFRAYDNFKWNDENFRKYVSEDFDIPFYQTRDSLLWGTGTVKNSYSYIIVSWDGVAFELSSAYNDKGFSHYSKWLLTTLREYHRKGKAIMFPIP